MRKMLLYRACSGVNNKVPGERLQYDPTTGVTDLKWASDILIDKTGGIASRRGSENVYPGEFVSAYPADGGGFYAVRNRTLDSAIEWFYPKADGSLDMVGVRSDLKKDAKTSFCCVGGQTFHSNGFQNGVISGTIAGPWPTSVWPRDTTEQFISTPVGSHIDILSGCFLVAVDNHLWFTPPGLYGIVSPTRGVRRWEKRIIMVFAVGTGAFVGDERAVYWCEGRDPSKWTMTKKLDYPAVEHAKAPQLVDPSFFGLQSTEPSALFGTVNGPVVGLPDGTCINLIDKKLSLPLSCRSGAIMIVDETTIIQTGA